MRSTSGTNKKIGFQGFTRPKKMIDMEQIREMRSEFTYEGMCRNVHLAFLYINIASQRADYPQRLFFMAGPSVTE